MSSVNDLSFDSVMFLVLTGNYSHTFIRRNRSPLLQVLFFLDSSFKGKEGYYYFNFFRLFRKVAHNSCPYSISPACSPHPVIFGSELDSDKGFSDVARTRQNTPEKSRSSGEKLNETPRF